MVTLKDVAKACELSSATVSCVMNGGPRSVLPATRDRVHRAVEHLGYQPKAAARRLMGKRSHTFGVVFPHVISSPFDNQYFSAVLTGIIDAASQNKQIPMLFTGLSWQEAERNVPLFCDGRCDGFLFVAPPPGSDLIRWLVDQQKSIVLVGTRDAKRTASTIDVDNLRASKLATNYLINLGHRRIGLLHSDRPSTSIPERVQGFCSAIADGGIPAEQAPIFSYDHHRDTRYGAAASYDAALEVLRSPEGESLTALVCTHDSTALHAIRAARALGKRIPEDLSVIGFDDLPLAAQNSPAITSVRQPLRQIGASAVTRLMDLIDGEIKGPSEELFDVHLMERATTSPPGRGQFTSQIIN